MEQGGRRDQDPGDLPLDLHNPQRSAKLMTHNELTHTYSCESMILYKELHAQHEQRART